MKLTKNQKLAAEKIEAGKFYAPFEALSLVKEVSSAKFDETVEVHFRLGIDTRQADQQLRGMVSLPNGSGKEVRVAVFAEGAAAEAAKEAGAEIVGSDDLVAEIQAGNIDFDATVATPDMMGKVAVLVKSSAPAVLCRTPSSAPLLPMSPRLSTSSRVARSSIAPTVTALLMSSSVRSALKLRSLLKTTVLSTMKSFV